MLGKIWSKVKGIFASKSARGGVAGGNSPYEAGFANRLREGTGKVREWLTEYETNCHLQAPFFRLAEDTALVGFKLYRELANGKRKQVRKHRILKLLKKPSPAMLGTAWKMLLQLYTDLVGEWFLWIQFAPEVVDGQVFEFPVALHIVPPHWMPQTPKQGEPWFVMQVPGGQRMRLYPHEVIWHKRPRPLNPYGRGLGIAPSLDDEVSQLDWMNKFNDSFFRQGAHLGTVLGVEDMPKELWDRFRQQFEEKHAGASNAFRTAVVSGKVSATNSVAAHKDLDFNEGVKLKRDVVRQTLGTPPEIHGQTENSNKATSDAASNLHQLYGQYPRCVQQEEALNEYLLPLFGEEDLVLVWDNPVKETEEQRLEKNDRGISRGTITVNDWRQAQGLDPTPDGDVYLIPENVAVVEFGTLIEMAQAALISAQNEAKNGQNQPKNVPEEPPKSSPKALEMPGKSLDHYLEVLQNA